MQDTAPSEGMMDQIKRRFARSFLDIVILQIVNASPTWGYDIIKKTQMQYKVKLRHGALYPLLQQLETEGFVKSRRELHKGRARKVYEITVMGIQLLDSYYNLIEQHLNSRMW